MKKISRNVVYALYKDLMRSQHPGFCLTRVEVADDAIRGFSVDELEEFARGLEVLKHEELEPTTTRSTPRRGV